MSTVSTLGLLDPTLMSVGDGVRVVGGSGPLAAAPMSARPTASGETFDKARLTAAHRTLPFGTRVAVTNLDNGRTVEVRVNDRGPFVAGRLLDLSEGAARAIGGIGAGLIHVRIRVVALPEGTDTAAGKPPPH